MEIEDISISVERILKIVELLKRGEDGEKKSAEAILKNLEKKYKIKIQDLLNNRVEETKRYYFFKWKRSAHRDLLVQIIYKVLKTNQFRFYYKAGNSKRGQIELTKLQFLEIDSLYEIYKRDYDEQLEIFYNAFIQKNRLFPDSVLREADEEREEPKLTDEDMERIRKITSMMEGIQRTQIHKQLTAGG